MLQVKLKMKLSKDISFNLGGRNSNSNKIYTDNVF